jgi:hypothetical protein
MEALSTEIPRQARRSANKDAFPASVIPVHHEAVIRRPLVVTAGLALAAR